MLELTGRLLVATPVIGDPNFERTVVLVLEHSDDGTMGVVLNRPSDVDVVDPLPEWQRLAASPQVVFVGGPVEQSAAIGLARVAFMTEPADTASPGASGEDDLDGFHAVVGTIGTLDLSRSPEDLASPIEQIRVFAGYAGWGPDQLDSELASDAWVVIDMHSDDVLGDDPEGLWSSVLRRQGGDLALLSLCPLDPSLN